MSEELPPDQGGRDRRKDPRAPLETEVRIEYGDFRGFVREFCRDVSVGGMFVECPNPPEPGRLVRFELELPPPVPQRISGRGEVAWRRLPGEEARPRAGFGLRFTEIDPSARRLIFRIIDRYVQRGGNPFDVGPG